MSSKDRSLFASLTADDHGTFEFQHLPADRFILTASHRGYLTESYDAHDELTTALVTGEDQNCCTNLQLRLTPGGVISGVVTEDSGDPVEHGRVTLYRESNLTGNERVQRVRMETLDESGAFDLSGLEPGNYFLSVNAEPWYAQHVRGMQRPSQRSTDDNEHYSPLDLVYATTFYPDTTDPDSATPIPVKGGDHLKINFSLHPVQAVHIKVPFAPNGARDRPLFPPQFEQSVFGLAENILVSTFFHTTSENNPEAEISVPPGHYVIRTGEANDAPGKQMSVDVSNDQVIDPSTGTQLAEVTGKFALTSGEALPESLFVSLQPPGGQSIGSDRVDKDGSFTIHNVPAGTYHINFFASGKRLHVTKLMANGAQVGHRQITIGSNPVTLAGLLYPDLELSVSGFVKKDGKAVPGVMVVLVPEDAANYRDYFRRDQSDWDGKFVMRDVEPGKYTVVAIQDGWTLDWAEPQVIRRYLPQGMPVNVTEHSPQMTELDRAVETQSK